MGWVALGVVVRTIAGAPEPVGPTLPPPPFAEHYTLEWEAPPQCPSAAEIEARISALRTTEERGEGTVAIRGRVLPRGDRFHLVLATEFRGHVETREIEESQCAVLGEATALVAALALQPASAEPTADPPPSVVDHGPPSTPEPSAIEVDVDPIPIEATPVRREPARARRRAPMGIVRLAGLLESGDLPGITGGPALALGVAGRRWRVELHGAWLAPRRRTNAGQGARYQAGLGGARGCYRAAIASIELPLCAGVEVGVVHARTHGVTPPRGRAGVQMGPLFSAGVARRWGRWGVHGAAEVVGRAIGYAFEFAGVERFRQAPVSARLVVGLEIFLP